MRNITVHLLKPGKGATITYHGTLLRDDGDHRLIHARWEMPPRDLGCVVFEPGDHFYEHYYTARWYNVFEVRAESGRLKGWYCNATRPARFDVAAIESEDLELDLFVSADRRSFVRLDMDEFEARHFDQATQDAALAALDELETLARAGDAPFDAQEPPPQAA
jgi:predicted RNA-binding protein associated with RNAse of E/G family